MKICYFSTADLKSEVICIIFQSFCLTITKSSLGYISCNWANNDKKSDFLLLFGEVAEIMFSVVL